MTTITVTTAGTIRTRPAPHAELRGYAVRRNGKELSRHATADEAHARAAQIRELLARMGEDVCHA